MLYEIWKSSSSSTFIPSDHNQKDILLEPDAEFIGNIEADSWEEAMTKYHEFMGWEPYKPMD